MKEIWYLLVKIGDEDHEVEDWITKQDSGTKSTSKGQKQVALYSQQCVRHLWTVSKWRSSEKASHICEIKLK